MSGSDRPNRTRAGTLPTISEGKADDAESLKSASPSHVSPKRNTPDLPRAATGIVGEAAKNRALQSAINNKYELVTNAGLRDQLKKYNLIDGLVDDEKLKALNNIANTVEIDALQTAEFITALKELKPIRVNADVAEEKSNSEQKYFDIHQRVLFDNETKKIADLAGEFKGLSSDHESEIKKILLNKIIVSDDSSELLNLILLKLASEPVSENQKRAKISTIVNALRDMDSDIPTLKQKITEALELHALPDETVEKIAKDLFSENQYHKIKMKLQDKKEEIEKSSTVVLDRLEQEKDLISVKKNGTQETLIANKKRQQSFGYIFRFDSTKKSDQERNVELDKEVTKLMQEESEKAKEIQTTKETYKIINDLIGFPSRAYIIAALDPLNSLADVTLLMSKIDSYLDALVTDDYKSLKDNYFALVESIGYKRRDEDAAKKMEDNAKNKIKALEEQARVLKEQKTSLLHRILPVLNKDPKFEILELGESSFSDFFLNLDFDSEDKVRRIIEIFKDGKNLKEIGKNLQNEKFILASVFNDTEVKVIMATKEKLLENKRTPEEKAAYEVSRPIVDEISGKLERNFSTYPFLEPIFQDLMKNKKLHIVVAEVHHMSPLFYQFSTLPNKIINLSKKGKENSKKNKKKLQSFKDEFLGVLNMFKISQAQAEGYFDTIYTQTIANLAATTALEAQKAAEAERDNPALSQAPDIVTSIKIKSDSWQNYKTSTNKILKEKIKGVIKNLYTDNFVVTSQQAAIMRDAKNEWKLIWNNRVDYLKNSDEIFSHQRIKDEFEQFILLEKIATKMLLLAGAYETKNSQTKSKTTDLSPVEKCRVEINKAVKSYNETGLSAISKLQSIWNENLNVLDPLAPGDDRLSAEDIEDKSIEPFLRDRNYVEMYYLFKDYREMQPKSSSTLDSALGAEAPIAASSAPSLASLGSVSQNTSVAVEEEFKSQAEMVQHPVDVVASRLVAADAQSQKSDRVAANVDALPIVSAVDMQSAIDEDDFGTPARANQVEPVPPKKQDTSTSEDAGVSSEVKSPNPSNMNNTGMHLDAALGGSGDSQPSLSSAILSHPSQLQASAAVASLSPQALIYTPSDLISELSLLTGKYDFITEYSFASDFMRAYLTSDKEIEPQNLQLNALLVNLVKRMDRLNTADIDANKIERIHREFDIASQGANNNQEIVFSDIFIEIVARKKLAREVGKLDKYYLQDHQEQIIQDLKYKAKSDMVLAGSDARLVASLNEEIQENIKILTTVPASDEVYEQNNGVEPQAQSDEKFDDRLPSSGSNDSERQSFSAPHTPHEAAAASSFAAAKVSDPLDADVLPQASVPSRESDINWNKDVSSNNKEIKKNIKAIIYNTVASKNKVLEETFKHLWDTRLAQVKNAKASKETIRNEFKSFEVLVSITAELFLISNHPLYFSNSSPVSEKRNAFIDAVDSILLAYSQSGAAVALEQLEKIWSSSMPDLYEDGLERLTIERFKEYYAAGSLSQSDVLNAKVYENFERYKQSLKAPEAGVKPYVESKEMEAKAAKGLAQLKERVDLLNEAVSNFSDKREELKNVIDIKNLVLHNGWRLEEPAKKLIRDLQNNGAIISDDDFALFTDIFNQSTLALEDARPDANSSEAITKLKQLSASLNKLPDHRKVMTKELAIFLSVLEKANKLAIKNAKKHPVDSSQRVDPVPSVVFENKVDPLLDPSLAAEAKGAPVPDADAPLEEGAAFNQAHAEEFKGSPLSPTGLTEEPVAAAPVLDEATLQQMQADKRAELIPIAEQQLEPTFNQYPFLRKIFQDVVHENAQNKLGVPITIAPLVDQFTTLRDKLTHLGDVLNLNDINKFRDDFVGALSSFNIMPDKSEIAFANLVSEVVVGNSLTDPRRRAQILQRLPEELQDKDQYADMVIDLISREIKPMISLSVLGQDEAINGENTTSSLVNEYFDNLSTNEVHADFIRYQKQSGIPVSRTALQVSIPPTSDDDVITISGDPAIEQYIAINISDEHEQPFKAELSKFDAATDRNAAEEAMLQVKDAGELGRVFNDVIEAKPALADHFLKLFPDDVQFKLVDLSDDPEWSDILEGDPKNGMVSYMRSLHPSDGKSDVRYFNDQGELSDFTRESIIPNGDKQLLAVIKAFFATSADLVYNRYPAQGGVGKLKQWLYNVLDSTNPLPGQSRLAKAIDVYGLDAIRLQMQIALYQSISMVQTGNDKIDQLITIAMPMIEAQFKAHSQLQTDIQQLELSGTSVADPLLNEAVNKFVIAAREMAKLLSLKQPTTNVRELHHALIAANKLVVDPKDKKAVAELMAIVESLSNSSNAIIYRQVFESLYVLGDSVIKHNLLEEEKLQEVNREDVLRPEENRIFSASAAPAGNPSSIMPTNIVGLTSSWSRSVSLDDGKYNNSHSELRQPHEFIPRPFSANNGAAAASASASPRGSVGSASPRGSVGSESPRGSVGSESPRSSVGSDSPRSSVGSDSPKGSVASESPRSSIGSDSPRSSVGSESLRGSVGSESLRGSVGSESLRGSVGSASSSRRSSVDSNASTSSESSDSESERSILGNSPAPIPKKYNKALTAVLGYMASSANYFAHDRSISDSLRFFPSSTVGTKWIAENKPDRFANAGVLDKDIKKIRKTLKKFDEPESIAEVKDVQRIAGLGAKEYKQVHREVASQANFLDPILQAGLSAGSKLLADGEYAVNIVARASDPEPLGSFVEHREGDKYKIAAGKLPTDKTMQSVGNMKIPPLEYLIYADRQIQRFLGVKGSHAPMYIKSHKDPLLVEAMILLCKKHELAYVDESSLSLSDKYTHKLNPVGVNKVFGYIDAQIKAEVLLPKAKQMNLFALTKLMIDLPDKVKNDPEIKPLAKAIKENKTPSPELFDKLLKVTNRIVEEESAQQGMSFIQRMFKR